METVAGIFQSRKQAEKAIQQIHSSGIRNDRIALLTPNTTTQAAERAVPTADTEQPGIGKAMGGTVGGESESLAAHRWARPRPRRACWCQALGQSLPAQFLERRFWEQAEL